MTDRPSIPPDHSAIRHAFRSAMVSAVEMTRDVRELDANDRELRAWRERIASLFGVAAIHPEHSK